MSAGIGGSTNPSTATNLQTLPIDDLPASFRYNNPGAQFPSKEAAKFGQLGYGSIDKGQYKIALFPSPVNGAAANFDLLYRNYTGMSIGAAGTKWTGANGFGVPGYDPATILTKETLDNPSQAIALLKAIAGRESGRGNNLTEDQWRQAHAMFQAGSADIYLDKQPAPVQVNAIAGTPSGDGLLKRAREHIGEKYVNVQVPKDDADYKGPWDCAEFISWLIYQEAHILYGCVDDSAPPAKADAYTGAFKTDLAKLGKQVPVDEAASTVGGILLRYPPGPGTMGHIVLCDGRGGTVEAKGTRYGVVADTVHNRPWDTGVLIPGISYNSSAAVAVTPPELIYSLGAPDMDKGVIIKIQTALVAKGLNPGVINGEFGSDTVNAVIQFQDAQGLTVDGQVGPETATALGISLKPDATPTGPVVPPQVLVTVPSAPSAPDASQLLALILMLLSKEKPMATDPAKPGQTVDIVGLLLPLLLQSLLSGKQIDAGQLLGTVLTGQTVAPAPVTPAAPAVKPAPPPAATPVAPTQIQPQQVSQTVNDVVTLLLPVLYQKITGQPWPGTVPVASVPTVVSPTPSVMSKPSVQIGAAGLGIASLLQALGTIAPPFSTALPAGATAATNATFSSPLVGTLATVIPLVVAGFGATGGWGSLLGMAGSLLGAISNAANKPK
jgi:Putative peptidoglycan binding domain